MSLPAGTRLGPYEIQSALGAGGMGEVYRARDTRLQRTVAIKILPAHISGQPDVKARFEREAQVLASLSHPHICPVFDVGAQEGVAFIVMECLEGQTLAARLERGALAVDEALAIAVQIAGALDAAHRAGIVHRDLKPGNVMLVRRGGPSGPPDGKLLDFGLAKASAPAVTVAATVAPTVGPGLTAQGMILGTFQYMAPEQLEGKDADARTDIFAFGALLYEMVTGRKAFEGKSHANLVAAILEREPAPISTIQPLTPPVLDRIVRTCLAKDPDDRWQTARDLHRELQWIADSPAIDAPAGQPAAFRRGWRDRALWAGGAGVLALLGIGLGAVAVRYLAEPLPEPIQFSIEAPPDAELAPVPKFAVSPDGRRVVFQAGSQLWLRALGEMTARPVPGTEGADATAYPFWSPDSSAIAYFDASTLKRVVVGGGPAVMLARAPAGLGASWSGDNSIVFAPDGRGPLYRVAAAGGTPGAATSLDESEGEIAHRWPAFLPDGRRFLYTAYISSGDDSAMRTVIKVASLGSTDTTPVLDADMAVYAAGHLLFARSGTLLAQRFDPESIKLQGEPVPIADRLTTNPPGYASFSTSTSGVLAYVRSEVAGQRQLIWVDRNGTSGGAAGEPDDISAVFALSPDASRVVMSRGVFESDLWVTDVARSTTTRLTFEAGAANRFPAWSPDGRWIAFESLRPGAGLYRKPANGAGQDELLVPLGDDRVRRISWSRDGTQMVYSTFSPQTRGDIWLLTPGSDRMPVPLLKTPASEQHPAVAPDARWVAYDSDDTGMSEVYVQPFPATGAKYQISNGGGMDPRWRDDGRELFFVNAAGEIASASIDTANGLAAGTPKALFQGAFGFESGRYAVTGDGQRFLVLVAAQAVEGRMRLAVVVNWPSTIGN